MLKDKESPWGKCVDTYWVEVVFPFMGYIDMCNPKRYGF